MIYSLLIKILIKILIKNYNILLVMKLKNLNQMKFLKKYFPNHLYMEIIMKDLRNILRVIKKQYTIYMKIL